MKFNKMELFDNGVVLIRWEKALFDAEGNEVSAGYHRESLNPGNPGDSISDLPVDLQAVITAHWTPERVAKWIAAKAEV